MKKNLIQSDIAQARGKGGGELARRLSAIGAKLLDKIMHDEGVDENEAMALAAELLGMPEFEPGAKHGGAETAAANGSGNAGAARADADEAAAVLNELARTGELEGEIDDYLADDEFLELLAQFPARAALRIYNAEKRGREGEKRGERSIVEKLRMNGALPESGKGGKAVDPRVDFMKISKQDFEKFKRELAKKAGR